MYSSDGFPPGALISTSPIPPVSYQAACRGLAQFIIRDYPISRRDFRLLTLLYPPDGVAERRFRQPGLACSIEGNTVQEATHSWWSAGNNVGDSASGIYLAFKGGHSCS
ncbi:hypothetical protein [Bradyrhizobium sp. 195]|uniref:hypothetical protein n=1 Tax=Bradyrhizobium sp. 195 TaxID=2782662 RepID=UPI0020012509|nr:hypothetical protein [Bradyrhizobium sp. 195]UPK29251.1 hypothetical protein IVB26_12880 [Bradyrhizobium sp. 195]